MATYAAEGLRQCVINIDNTFAVEMCGNGLQHFHSHSRPTNERHLSLNNQTMINVQNANTQLS